MGAVQQGRFGCPVGAGGWNDSAEASCGLSMQGWHMWCAGSADWAAMVYAEMGMAVKVCMRRLCVGIARDGTAQGPHELCLTEDLFLVACGDG